MRGKARCAGLGEVVGGITPAYAGKSLFGPLDIAPYWDHPRVCGEKEKLQQT